MLTVETLQPENKVLTSILHTLAEEGLVTIEGEEDEEIGETTLHYKLIRYLVTALELFLGDKKDVFIAANLRLSYSEKQPLKWYAPDVLVAFGVENKERSSYQLSTEKVMPQVIFEVTSAQTADKDLGEKCLMYARLGVEEYYLLDPERAVLFNPMLAFQHQNGKLSPAILSNNKIFSPRLGLEIGDTGDAFRLYNPETKEFLFSTEEMANQVLQEKSEIKELKNRIAELEAVLHQNKG